MKMYVDKDLCIACGACISICPDVFTWGDDGKAEAIKEEIPQEVAEDAQKAMESCPVDAIKEK